MKKTIITLDDWADDFSRTVTEEIYKTLESIEGAKSSALKQKLPLAFLSRFITITVYRALRERPDHIKTNKEAYDHAYKNLNLMKSGISEAVSTGLRVALTEFSGKDVDYMCTIKVMPEPMNTKPC